MEQSHADFLFPSTFGTPASDTLPGYIAPFMPKNVSNTSVLPFRGGILAMFESAQPYRLDAESLSTEGMDLMGGTLQRGVPFETGLGFVDAAAGESQFSIVSSAL